MGGQVTARSGFHPDYPRMQATAAASRSPLGYYAAAAAKGEPEGRWFGAALPELGLAEGEAVDMLELGPDAPEGEMSAYVAVYGQVNPRTGERIGRAPMKGGKRKEEILERLYAANPEATRERRRALGIRASRETRESAPYTDVTLSWSKSISVFHASIRQNERVAREAGDLAAAAYWAGREAKFQAVLQDANLAMLRKAEKWAGQVRTGYHGAKVNGEEQGIWAAAGLAVTSWLQGTNRLGEPHDHQHNLFARMARTQFDGKWRALDTMALRRELPELQAVAAAHVEAGLTREFGVEWERNGDKGNEIRGVTREHMDLFSRRAQEVDARLAQIAEEFREKYGRAPTRPEIHAMHADAWAGTGAGRGAELNEAQLAQAARGALARVQAAKATWTRAELVKHLGLAMPPESRSMDPDALVDLLGQVADRALAGEFEPVVPLFSESWVPTLPCDIRELDGRSIYTRPGSARYATRAQLSMEERTLAYAQRVTQLRMTRERAALAVGADADALDAALREQAREARGADTRSGLRLDQGAALYYALTSPRLAEVLVGPAGSGKTRTLAQASAAWQDTGRQVIGIAASQAACNVLTAAGVPRAENTSVFLGHVPGERGARGVTELEPGTLILLDEASMMSAEDLHDILAYTARNDCKVIICGDHAQLEAVESGGGLGMLASMAGYVQLGEAVRFAEPWEGPLSLRLREGDAEAAAEYDARGRVRGGTPEDVMADARRLYVSHYVQGTDVRLLTASRELGREMGRQVQSDLRHLGLVDGDGPAARVAGGQEARRGDLLRVTKNSRRAGVTNRDILRVEAVCDDGSLTVRRSAGRDEGTGKATWADGTFQWKGYRHAELAYWSTAHAAQGETVTVGVALITGSEDAHWLYSAMTRGAEQNIACVFTTPSVADPKPGGRADPELARHERVTAERAGEPVPEAHAEGAGEPRDPAAVLADIASRTERELSALEYRQRAMSDAHHLSRLAARWDGATRDLRRGAYRQALLDCLPAEYHAAIAQDAGTATWLWRSMRAAEAAGRDIREVAREATRASLEGAENIPSVIDWRIRRAVPAIPAAARPWAEQVPEGAEPDVREHLQELAAAMDARKTAIGEHAAETGAQWAVSALGPVPETDPLDRLDWERRAAHIGAYREMYGWNHEGDPIGMEPAGDAPEKRAAWHTAQAAITRTDCVDLTSDPDGRLHFMRDTYRAETSWAPEYPVDRLRALRTAVIDTAAQAARSQAEAAAAQERGDAEMVARHEEIGTSSRALEGWYRRRAEGDAAALEDYRAWSRVTEGSRRLAVLADAELRRRYPDAELAPLATAEPELPGAELPAMPETAEETTAAITAAEAARARFAERLEERQNVRVPDEDPDYEPAEEAWPAPFGGRDRAAILQPPLPPIRPAQPVLEAEAAREAGS
jgi:hypothetical protein